MYFLQSRQGHWLVVYVRNTAGDVSCFREIGEGREGRASLPLYADFILFLCSIQVFLNPFVPNAPFFYPLETLENRKVGRERVHWEQMG